MEQSPTPKQAAKRSSGSRRPTGREQGRVVRRYLAALDASRSGRGAKRSIEAISSRVLKIDELLITADPLARLHFTQERIDLHAELVRLSNGAHGDLADLEKDFVRVAKSYGEQAGISFAAWRQVGVDADVLERAGIVRTTPPRERSNGGRSKAAPEAPPDAAAAADAPARPAPSESPAPAPEPPTQAELPEIPSLPDPPPPAADLPDEAPAEAPAPKLRRRRIPDEEKG